MMTRLAPALTLAFVIGTPAMAENAHLRAALSVLPDTVFSGLSPDIARYLDLSALAEAHDGTLERGAMSRAQLGSDIRPAEALILGTPEGFSEKAGIDSAALAFLAGVGQPPDAVSLWGFAEQDAASAAFSGLTERGFVEMPSKMMANGEPGIIDIASLDPADPWRGPMGQASVVALSGPALLQAEDATVLEPFLPDRSSALDTAAGKTILDVLEAQEGTVLQAAFVGPWHGLSSIDPAIFTGKPRDEAEAALEQAVATASGGLPLWQGAALADVETAGKPVLLIALAYATCPEAQAAAEGAAELWRGMDGTAEDVVESSVRQPAPSGCAAILHVTHPNGTPRPFTNATRGLLSGKLPALRIGSGS